MPNASPNSNMSQEARENFGVLAQRIQTVEANYSEIKSNISSVNEKIDNQARNQQDKIDTLFRGLDQRLTDQIGSLAKSLGQQVDAVNEKVNAGRVPNYAVVLGFIGLLVTIFGVVYSFVARPIEAKFNELSLIQNNQRSELINVLTDIRSVMVPRSELSERWRIIERDSDANREATAARLTRDEFREFKNTYENNRITSRNDNNAKFEKLDRAIESMNQAQVPRGEHEQIWRRYDQEMGGLKGDIEEVKKQLSEIFSVKDIISRILDSNSKQDELIRQLQLQLQQSQAVRPIQ